MQKITSVDGLKQAIELLETEQVEKGRLLKEEFFITYNSLRPVNLVRQTLKDLFSPSDRTENLSGTAIDTASGYLLKRYFIGSSGSKLKKLIASIIQFGIINTAARFSDQFAIYGKAIFQSFLRKNKLKSVQLLK
jgi:hypothetical protein